MASSIDPLRFVGKDFVVHPTARGECSILLDGIAVGRIHRGPNSWNWMLEGPDMSSVAGASKTGEARSLAEAKTEMRGQIDKWLDWSLPRGQPAPWQGSNTGSV